MSGNSDPEILEFGGGRQSSQECKAALSLLVVFRPEEQLMPYHQVRSRAILELAVVAVFSEAFFQMGLY